MNAISNLSFGVVSALVKDLLPYEQPNYRFDRPKESGDLPKRIDTSTKTLVRPSEDQCQIFFFKQTWGSSCLGFGGIGGQAMTSAYTTVVIGPMGDACAYFGCRLAYHINKPNKLFFEHIASCCLLQVAACSKYENKG